MGMTIDDSIKFFTSKSRCYLRDYEYCLVAVETMHKYQKIQEIVNSKTTRLSYELGFRQIRKVIEDGTD